MSRARGQAKCPKPLSKKVEKPPVHRKRPGFNAFKTNSTGKKGGLVSCKEVAAPETGIHSLGWASRIAPNTSGLFKLSTELRLRIWKDVIEAIDTPAICPCKAQNKFTTFERPTRFERRRPVTDDRYSVGTIMVILYTICRQAYVDIYGSALLYRIKPFLFPSPERMLNYLAVINPLHRNSICSITLNCKLYKSNIRKFASEATWPMLQSMDSLRSLEIVLIPHSPLLQGNWTPPYRTFKTPIFEQVIEEVKKHEGLKGIRGLKSFSLRVECCPPIQEKVVSDVCEDIKKVVLLEKPARVSDMEKS